MGWLESDLLLSSVVITGLWLVVSGLLVSRLLVSRLLVSRALVRGLLVVAVAGLVVDGLNSGWIGIAHGLIAVGALLLLLQLKFHLEQLDFLLLLDQGKIIGRPCRLLLLPLLAAVDDLTDESTAESDELGLCGVAAVAAGLIRGPIAVISAIAT